MAHSLYVPPGAVIPLITRCTTMWSRTAFDMAIEDPNEELRLYIWGEVHYADVFQKSHVVKFRFVKKQGSGWANLDYCPEGNEAD